MISQFSRWSNSGFQAFFLGEVRLSLFEESAKSLFEVIVRHAVADQARFALQTLGQRYADSCGPTGALGE
jgi:hypothetical protein